RLLSAGADLGPFGIILLGGAAAPARLLQEASEAGGRVVTTYGMTETCGGCVYDGVPLDGVRVAAGPDGRIRGAGPVLVTGGRMTNGASGSPRWWCPPTPPRRPTSACCARTCAGCCPPAPRRGSSGWSGTCRCCPRESPTCGRCAPPIPGRRAVREQ